MKKMICALALGGAFLAPEVLAWGTDGHRAVGAIADQLILGTPAGRRVAALLLPGESLESVANWADCAKGPYCGPQTAEMTAFTTANPRHGQYHYTDIPFQNAHYRDGEVGSAPDDIVQTLKQCIAVLQGRDDPASNPHRFSQREALILLA
ncbi:MAG TPA: phospholipase, partial [Janthinobacterium sp.]|nr:phospholipase [Janthinobacterium sp.]